MMMRTHGKPHWAAWILTAVAAFFLGNQFTQHPILHLHRTQSSEFVQDSSQSYDPSSVSQPIQQIADVSNNVRSTTQSHHPRVSIAKRVAFADFAALNAVGGNGRIISVTSGQVAGQSAWDIQLKDDHAQTWKVVVRRANDTVISTKRVARTK